MNEVYVVVHHEFVPNNLHRSRYWSSEDLHVASSKEEAEKWLRATFISDYSYWEVRKYEVDNKKLEKWYYAPTGRRADFEVIRKWIMQRIEKDACKK